MVEQLGRWLAKKMFVVQRALVLVFPRPRVQASGMDSGIHRWIGKIDGSAKQVG